RFGAGYCRACAVACEQRVDLGREAGEDIALLEAERCGIAVRHRIAKDFDQQETGINARRRLAAAAGLEKRGSLRDLARALGDAGLVHALIRHREGAQARAEHAPFAMMPQHGLCDAEALSRRMSFSESRFPLFRDMLQRTRGAGFFWR